jgi:heterokaryon incompatibility protein (HET)
MTNLTTYTYKPLSSPTSIRLIHLLPSDNEDDPLKCDLEEVDLKGHQMYEAISYVWGDETNPSSVSCEKSHISITRNLDAALRRFRRPTEERTLWVDSICINQKDVPERNSQVSIMGDVYFNAIEVLIWLGLEDEYEDTQSAMKFIPYLCSKWSLDPGKVPTLETVRQKFANSTHDNRKLILKSTSFRAFRAFVIDRPLFRRAWTFQESCIAQKKSFHCGKIRLSRLEMRYFFDVLLSLFEHLDESNESNVNSIGYAVDMVFTYMEAHDSTHHVTYGSLVDRLSRRRGAECKIPSDVIYSVLATVCTDWKTIIQPDYQKPFHFLFLETTVEIIQRSGSLSIFGEVDSAFIPCSLLPSWCPDWRRPYGVKRHRPFLLGARGVQHLFRACGSAIATAKLHEEKKELTLRGIVLDTISAQQSDPFNSSTLGWLQQALNHANSSNQTYTFTAETISDALARTIQDDHTFENGQYIRRNKAWLKKRGEEHSETHFNNQDSYINGQAEQWAKLDILKLSRLFLTKRGMLGLGCVASRPGDIITILFGGKVPIILRPIEGGKFLFVRECYVHGFMDGEALIEARKEADPTYDGIDTAWLERLHEDPIPFPTREFVLV